MPSRELTDLQQRAYTAMATAGARAPDGKWLTAQRIGELIPHYTPPNRHGNQANGGHSWSGTQSEGFSLASTMRGLRARGFVEVRRDEHDPRGKDLYRITR